MQNVTAVFDRFRVAARSIWNAAFWPDPDFHNWNSVNQFDAIAQILFDELVLTKLKCEWDFNDIFRLPIPFFHVQPKSTFGCPVLIQNPRPGNPGVWDDPVNRIRPGESALHFLQYFDWSRLDYIDFQYYRTRIEKFDAQPHLVGRDVLVETKYVDVFLVDDQRQLRNTETTVDTSTL